MSTEHAAHDAESRVQAILKAVVVDAGGSTRASRSVGEELAWSDVGALEPPYDPLALCLLAEHSSSLRQNVDSYAVNIDGFGFRLEAVIDFDADNAQERIADAMLLERLGARERGELDDSTPLRPSDDEVTARLAELEQLARLEKSKLEAFFDACCLDGSFIDLRRRTRQDLEITGNAYWEVLRDCRGCIARLVYVPAYSVRLLPLDTDIVEVEERVRVSPISFEMVTTPRRLRRYVQVECTHRVYFKSFRDPRVVSRRTGRVFPNVEALLASDPDDGVATELIHFCIPSPRSPYGIPRWIGTLLSVLGSRAAEEVNYSYFSNKSVPPLALLVSGGHLSPESVPRIERFIDENLKGKANFHKILILEAESSAGSGSGHQAKIELKSLTEAQQQDALFGKYDERNGDKIGGAFRLPRLLRGDSRDFNRATASSALRFTEEQVFQPERSQFDYLINRLILGDLGIRFWRFQSLAPVTRDPETMSEMVERLVRVGVLTPEEGRDLAGDIFNKEFRKLDADWARIPIALTIAGIEPGSAETSEDATDAPAPSTPPDRLAMARSYIGGDREPQADDDRE